MEIQRDFMLKDAPSHFNWNLYQDATGTFASVKNSLDEHLLQNPGQRTVETYLFMSYLYMSEFMQDDKDHISALENLEKAKDEIIRTTQETSPARIGFMIVALSNEALIASMRSEGDKVKDLEKGIKGLIELSTQESQIYVDVVHAFALSRLGMVQYKKAKVLYTGAVAKFRNDISSARSAVKTEPEKLHWLFALALMIGRIARYEAGPRHFIDDMNEEIELFEMILEIKPEYALASAHLAQCYSLKKDTKKAQSRCLNAFTHAPNNPSVLRIVGTTLRKEKCFEDAMAVFEQCESLGANNSYLYHQWGLVFRSKYFQQKHRSYKSHSRGRGHHYNRGHGNTFRGGEATCVDDLLQAIERFTKAFDCDNHNCMALLDRASAYEELRDLTNARADYEKLVSLPKIEVAYLVAIHYCYGIFLKKHDQLNEALEHFHIAVDNYCIITPISTLHAADRPTERMKDGDRAMRCVTEIAEKMIFMRSDTRKIKGHKSLAKVLYIKGKYEHAYNEYERCIQIDDNCSDFDVLKGIVNCCLEMKELRRAESFIDKLVQLQYGEITPLRIKLLLLKEEHEYSEGRNEKARGEFTKAVIMGSLEACDKLFQLLKTADEDEKLQWVFRSQCAAILSCYSKAHPADIKLFNDNTSMIIKDENDNEEADDTHGTDIPPTLPDRIKSLINIEHRAIIDLEQIILEKGEKETVETFRATMSVFSSVHQVLEHSMAAFRNKFYPDSKKRCPYKYIRARDIAEPMTYDDVKVELLRLLDGTKKDNKGSRSSLKWVDFEERFPEFLDFLVKIQPGYNSENNWYIAVAKLDNLHKHDKHFFQQHMCDAYDIPVVVRGTGDKAKDKDAEHVLPAGNMISGSGGATMVRHQNAEYQVFRIRDLARKAATEVERIVSAFYAGINSPE